jgi:hypothetical protein
VKFALSHPRALLLGVALIVATNAVVLAGVAYNRRGEPESTLRLTERELSLRNWSWPENENSSIDLHLSWRIAPDPRDALGDSRAWYRSLSWLKPAELQELGFEIDADIETREGAERIRRQPSRRAWVVLEYDGPAYQASVARARKRFERAVALVQANAGEQEFATRLISTRNALKNEETFATRLFVVDVGRDEAALRKQYPDRQQYAIANGRLSVMIEGESGRKRVTAQVAGIDVDAIRVPHTYRSLVEPYAQAREYGVDRAPRFAATVNFGRRFEPWIVDLALLN